MSHLLFRFLVLVFILFSFQSCRTQSVQSIDYVNLTAPVQSLLETVLTYHAHQVVLDIHSDELMVIDPQLQPEWLFVDRYPTFQWKSVSSDSLTLYSLFSEKYIRMNDTTSIRFGNSYDRPFFIQEQQSTVLFNGPVDLTIYFDTYSLKLSIHYQDVLFTKPSVNREISGSLFYSVQFIDSEISSQIQSATGHVDFSNEWIRVNDQEYRFSELPHIQANLF